MSKHSPSKKVTIEFTSSELEVIFGALCQAVHLHDPLGRENPRNASPKEVRRMKAVRSMREWFGRLASEAGSYGDQSIDWKDIPHMMSNKEWADILDCY